MLLMLFVLRVLYFWVYNYCT